VRIALKQHKVPEKPHKWYLSMRDQKEIRTTGWVMGIEMFLVWVLRHDNIRDLAVKPRIKGTGFVV